MKRSRKPIRLDPEAYRIGHCFSVTIRTAFHQHVFLSPHRVNVAFGSLQESAVTFSARVYAYCFMPDHFHLLARTPPGIDFLEFIRQFKQLSGHRLRVESGDNVAIWQPRFYDHALRSAEGILPVARYIFANPIRAGIVEKAHEYPYSGSLEWPDILTAGLESPGLHTLVVPE